MNDEQLRPFLHYAGGNKVMGIILAVVCFAIGSVGFLDPTASTGVKYGLLVPFGVFGLFFLFIAFRPASKHAVIKVLRERIGDVVWVYPSTQTVNNQPSMTFVNFGLADGSSKALGIGAKGDPAPLMGIAKQAIPHATFGYTPELEARFKKSPGELRKQA